MMNEKNNIQREILPIPDIPHVGLTTYDAKDPETKYPPVEPEKTPEEGYYFTEDMTDKVINWVRQQKALMPDKPFLIYFATGATHAPHHVPPEWSAKYKGKFDQGVDDYDHLISPEERLHLAMTRQ